VFSPVCLLKCLIESLEFVGTLWQVLGRTCPLILFISTSGKLVIRLASEIWDTILNSYSKYFNNIYGDKYIAFQNRKLIYIQRLILKYLKLDLSSHQLLALAIHIVYDISADGITRNL
jgi:hypothetical protein